MNLTVFSCSEKVYRNCECIQGFAFKMVAQRGKSALLEAFNAPKIAVVTALRDKCAHFDRSPNLSLVTYAP